MSDANNNLSFQQAKRQFEYGWGQYVSGAEGKILSNSMKKFAEKENLKRIYYNPMHCIKVLVNKKIDQKNIKRCFLVAYELSKLSKLGFNHHVIKLIIERGSLISLNIESSIGIITQFREELELGDFFNPELFSDDALTDIDNADKRGVFSTLSKTERDSLIKSRIGQGKFRDDLLKYWDNKCSVTGFDIEPLLIASHIKPWRSCSNSERLDKFNGLLLTPGLDSVFDKGFVTFLDDGAIYISEALNNDDLRLLGIFIENLKSLRLDEKHKVYLKYHRKHVYENWK